MTPAWHDKPTEPGPWLISNGGLWRFEIVTISSISSWQIVDAGDRYYGPIPPDNASGVGGMSPLLGLEDQNALFAGGATIAEATQGAYKLGIERARRVRQLWWTRSAEFEVSADGPCKKYVINRLAHIGKWQVQRITVNGATCVPMDLDEAKATCQAHYELLVLSMLDLPL